MHRLSRGYYLSRRDKYLDLDPKHLIWSEFAETTTCHGVKEILRSRKCFWKFFWTLSVLVHVGLLVVGCSKVTYDYFTMSTVTKIAVTHNGSMELPRLAFCLPNSLDEERMMEGFVPSDIIREVQCGISGKLQLSDTFTKYLHRVNKTMKEFVELYSYSCENLLIEGGYGDEVNYKFCAKSQIIHHKHYGLCHVIEGGNQVVPGVQGGYRLHFLLPDMNRCSDDSHSNELLSFANGLAIELGSRQYRHSNLNSLLISRNKFASVSLRSEFHERVYDGGLCTKRESKFSSGTTCYFWCRVKALHDACSCGLYGVSDIYDPSLTLCSFQDRPCLLNQTDNNDIQDKVISCQKHCKPLCEEWEYKPSVTYIDMGHKIGQSKSHVRIIVGYSAMEYKKVVEVKSFTAFMAISSLGGQAGLWMGCSILTVIHAFTYCLWALGMGCTNRIKTIVKKDSVHFVDDHGNLQKSVKEVQV